MLQCILSLASLYQRNVDSPRGFHGAQHSKHHLLDGRCVVPSHFRVQCTSSLSSSKVNSIALSGIEAIRNGANVRESVNPVKSRDKVTGRRLGSDVREFGCVGFDCRSEYMEWS